MRRELGESVDHLMQAAAHAAGGVGATVGPRVAVVRTYMAPGMGKVRNVASQGWESTVTALTPLTAAAKEGSRKAMVLRIKKEKRSMARKRWSMLAGLLAAGAAVGAAGAMVVRRRRRAQWDEYDASHPMGSVEKTREPMASGVDTAAAKATSAIDKGAGRHSSAMGGSRDKPESATETAQRQAERAGDKTDELIGKTGTPSKNSRT